MSGGDAVDVDPSYVFSTSQTHFRLIIFLLARYNVDLPACIRKTKRQIRENLARGRMIRKEEAIQKDQAPHFND